MWFGLSEGVVFDMVQSPDRTASCGFRPLSSSVVHVLKTWMLRGLAVTDQGCDSILFLCRFCLSFDFSPESRAKIWQQISLFKTLRSILLFHLCFTPMCSLVEQPS